MNYIYNGFLYASLAEAEAARDADGGGWWDGQRKAIWPVERKPDRKMSNAEVDDLARCR